MRGSSIDRRTIVVSTHGRPRIVGRGRARGTSLSELGLQAGHSVERQNAAKRRLKGLLQHSALLPVLVTVWCLTSTGPTVAAERLADGLPSKPTGSDGYMPYLSVGVGRIRTDDPRFGDGDDSGHALLYRSPDRFDAVGFDAGLQTRLAAGVRMRSGFRAELEAGLARGLDFRGATNYRNAGNRQPSTARLDIWQFLFAADYEFPEWQFPPADVCGRLRRCASRPATGPGHLSGRSWCRSSDGSHSPLFTPRENQCPTPCLSRNDCQSIP